MRAVTSHFAVALFVVFVTAGISASRAVAACGDVPPESASITAADALAILRTAVGLRECADCVCDVNDSATITAGDALAVLRAAVGQPIVLECPSCGSGPDTTVLADAYCDYTERCEPVFLDYLNQTVSECFAERKEILDRQYSGVEDAVASGRLEFLPDVFEACLIAYEESDCVLGLAGACEFFDGKRTEGQSCSLAWECDEDLFCNGVPDNACGTCEARAAVGEECSDAVCVEFSRCLLVGQDAICISDDVSEGSDCGTAETGLCAGRLQCVGDDDQTCVRPAELEEACDSSGAAADCNLYQKLDCVAGECVAASFNAPGSSCVAPSSCDVDGYCNESDVCAALPTGGEACGFLSCAQGFYCAANSKCAAVRQENQSCTSSGECVEGLYCLGSPGAKTCRRLSFTSCP